MRLYERLGVDADLDIALEKRLNMLDLDANLDLKELEWNLGTIKHVDIMVYQQVALAYCLLEDFAQATRYARIVLEKVEDYLLGEWRESWNGFDFIPDVHEPKKTVRIMRSFNRAECRKQFIWMEAFRRGLLWALCLNKDAVLRLAQYPGEDLPDETDVGGSFGSAEKSCYVLLSNQLLGGESSGLERHSQTIDQGRKKRPKLLLAALRQIERRDPLEFSSALVECLRYHVRYELPQRGLDNKFALDPSILYLAAKRSGLDVSIPQKYQDHLITIE